MSLTQEPGVSSFASLHRSALLLVLRFSTLLGNAAMTRADFDAAAADLLAAADYALEGDDRAGFGDFSYVDLAPSEEAVNNRT